MGVSYLCFSKFCCNPKCSFRGTSPYLQNRVSGLPSMEFGASSFMSAGPFFKHAYSIVQGAVISRLLYMVHVQRCICGHVREPLFVVVMLYVFVPMWFLFFIRLLPSTSYPEYVYG
jgi:hypothetical protein